MSRRRVKITGSRGSWVAKVEGRTLGVLHHTMRESPPGTGHRGRFEDGDPRDSKRYQQLEAALRSESLVVIQRDVSATDLTRDGYVGVFGFKDLEIDYDRGFTLTLTHRHADPAP